VGARAVTLIVILFGCYIVHLAATVERRVPWGAAWLDDEFGKSPENLSIARACEWGWVGVHLALFAWMAWS
jgi:hypothetical protein